ncbi:MULTISPECIES: mannitol dehydrogenase family protein [unclassified Rhizobium]|uniref:mannitol dehydrogenase family protein n=1 Tax=unclassified Rhizobium TaxID=2613769 RepID=UPI001ADA3C4A|nr:MULTISPECIES: mannitol dehydrogenase family protein [unclassified Rhizobium]MBO9123729.1 mannitol dehydrogenase family protein [Rhizobium sp. 16-488-2b]MBO9174261.1 mannitol dehydrogenase family protein [Rhizobium sp. 16-488-2a]
MQKLSKSAELPAGVQAPTIQPANFKAGILHIGVGAFHRAHQAIYTEDAMASEGGNWGIIGVSLRSRDIVDDLRSQDMLYSVTTRDAQGDHIRVVGSIVGALAASVEAEAVLRQLADPEIRIVSLTVTEKAYGLDPASGGLDRNHPAVAHDLQNPHNPTGAIGFLVEGLARRRLAGDSPYTILCCDNLPSNGDVVKKLVLDMARERDPSLSEWIESRATFPNTMVDRIVPAAAQDTRDRAAGLLGVDDTLALETESFIQWVIEDNFVSGRPAWEKAGALFVDDVAPYEKMKLRLLNGSHSLIAYLGQLHGLDYVRDVMAVAKHRERVRQHMQIAAKTLDPVPGIGIAVYIDDLLSRFANPTIAHRTAQIAMDGTQKLPQRIFSPAVDALQAGGDIGGFAYVTALWLAFVLRQDRLDDPRSAELLRAARASCASANVSDRLQPFIALPGLFPAALANSPLWRNTLIEQMNALDAEL